MAIQESELKVFKSVAVADTPANGGVMSANEILSGVKNNVFPDVSQAQRTAGITQYRKVFHKVANANSEKLVNPMIHLLGVTPADDWMTIFLGTQSDTQNDIAAPDEYGAAALAANISATDSEATVTLEDSSLVIFRDADKIFITDGVKEEYHENVTILKVGGTVTITLDTGDQFANDYASADSIIASVIDVPDIECSVDNWAESSSVGTYDEGNYPVLCNNLGTVEDTFTVTFTSATAFTCAGARLGSLGAGSINSDFEPTNPDSTTPYFSLQAIGWGGTWQAGETVIFKTHPAAVPIWRKRVVPAGAASFAANSYSVRFSGETA